MGNSIIFLGEVPAADGDLLREVVATFGFDGKFFPVEMPPKFDSGHDIPCGCISFIPCTQEAMLDLFGAMPIGFGQEIPLFQRVDGEEVPAFCAMMPFIGFFRSPLSPLNCRNMMMTIARCGMLTSQNRDVVGEMMKYRKQKHQLIKIGTSVSLQNDLEKLLSLILAESRDVVAADAGSVYIREKSGPGGSFTDSLRFKISQNDSVDIAGKSSEFSIPINNNSVAGYVALKGETLSIEDLGKLNDSVPFKKTRKEYEDKFAYQVKSTLTVPLKNLSGEVAGVLQLMNKKNTPCRLLSSDDVEKFVAPFTQSDEDFVHSIASQAAVSIERVQLYQEIKDIFEGYLGSSIAAIDERDRVTYGHSRRVMGYAMAFADAVNRENGGPFAGMLFSEDRKNQFRFAALLHDIGKIGVPEALLTKEFRLSTDGLAVIRARAEYVKLLLVSMAAAKGPLSWQSPAHVDSDVEFLVMLNKVGSINDEDFARLQKIRGKFYFDAGGGRLPFLTDLEFEYLSVRKGNLTEKERERINFHAQATRRILSRIPWTRELQEIPEIASHHHERLDGSGYPDGLKDEQLSFESKALAVIDIFEALVAQDRPYKPKMAPQKAIEILRAEVKANHLDGRIVEFFISSGTYKIFLDETQSDAARA
jgi:HD-GYP domain-containing protein (c-di-GMP phosphodiesterase class II)